MKRMALYLVIITVVFISGVWVGTSTSNPWYAGAHAVESSDQKITRGDVDIQGNPDLSTLWEAWHLIQETSFELPENRQEMVYGLIEGLVDSLGDDHSVYFSPEETKMFLEDMRGSFYGIGVSLRMKEKRIIITGVMEDGPASKTDLKKGDIILKVDEQEIRKKKFFQVIKMIRGKKNVPVKLTIWREGLEEPKEITIVRDEVKEVVLKHEMRTINDQKIGIIKLNSFNKRAVKEFTEAVAEMKSKGMDSFILDLRNNLGGSLRATRQILSAWSVLKVMLYTKTKDGEYEPQRAISSKGLSTELLEMPTVVLINGYSASASEITAGALKDLGFAIIVGKKTYGKGSVQTGHGLMDGSMVKLTFQHWFTPKKTPVNDVGIKPDIEVDMTDEDEDAKRDPQMDKAIETLSN